MWFKNARIYQVTEHLFDLHGAALDDELFKPCNGQQAAAIGFTYPVHDSVKKLVHEGQDGLFVVAVKRQEKILPAAVINEELQPKIAAIGEKVGGNIDEQTAKSVQKSPIFNAEDEDPLYAEAVAFVVESRKVSVSGIQRKFRIGYNRSAYIVEAMARNGVISEMGHNGNRSVLAPGVKQ